MFVAKYFPLTRERVPSGSFGVREPALVSENQSKIVERGGDRQVSFAEQFAAHRQRLAFKGFRLFGTIGRAQEQGEIIERTGDFGVFGLLRVPVAKNFTPHGQ